jgi:hypothetical protein
MRTYCRTLFPQEEPEEIVLETRDTIAKSFELETREEMGLATRNMNVKSYTH